MAECSVLDEARKHGPLSCSSRTNRENSLKLEIKKKRGFVRIFESRCVDERVVDDVETA